VTDDLDPDDLTAAMKRLQELAEQRGYSRGFDAGWDARTDALTLRLQKSKDNEDSRLAAIAYADKLAENGFEPSLRGARVSGFVAGWQAARGAQS